MNMVIHSGSGSWTWPVVEMAMKYTVLKVIFNIAIEAMAIEMMWIYPLNMVISHSYVNVYQRVVDKIWFRWFLLSEN